MPTAVIAYLSATFTTATLAEELRDHLLARGIEATAVAIDDCDPATVAGVDYLFLGAWTHGWFVVRQHPDAAWVAWVRGLPRLERPAVALFTTYRVRTGSMFRRMREPLAGKGARIGLELQAKGPHLTAETRRAVDAFLDAGAG
jgi:flavodoxin